jgi:hypothetical protein
MEAQNQPTQVRARRSQACTHDKTTLFGLKVEHHDADLIDNTVRPPPPSMTLRPTHRPFQTRPVSNATRLMPKKKGA